MSIRAKIFIGGAATFAAMALMSGCSSSVPAESSYALPGAELGTTIVEPPAPLPPPEIVETSQEQSTVTCAPVEQLSEDAIVALNNPAQSLSEGAAALHGELVVSGEQMPVESRYPKAFSELVKLQLDSGESVWLGSIGSLNAPEVYSALQIIDPSVIVVFGANAQAYETLKWGEALGSNSALVQESTKFVDTYGECF